VEYDRFVPITNGMCVYIVSLVLLGYFSTGGIMDLDHYLEKMNTTTSFIEIPEC
jgi:hypothetical protein